MKRSSPAPFSQRLPPARSPPTPEQRMPPIPTHTWAAGGVRATHSRRNRLGEQLQRPLTWLRLAAIAWAHTWLGAHRFRLGLGFGFASRAANPSASRPRPPSPGRRRRPKHVPCKCALPPPPWLRASWIHSAGGAPGGAPRDAQPLRRPPAARIQFSWSPSPSTNRWSPSAECSESWGTKFGHHRQHSAPFYAAVNEQSQLRRGPVPAPPEQT
eukprot:scaffold89211_cov54-Phaeocystis_antarctica.AAC.2